MPVVTWCFADSRGHSADKLSTGPECCTTTQRPTGSLRHLAVPVRRPSPTPASPSAPAPSSRPTPRPGPRRPWRRRGTQPAPGRTGRQPWPSSGASALAREPVGRPRPRAGGAGHPLWARLDDDRAAVVGLHQLGQEGEGAPALPVSAPRVLARGRRERGEHQGTRLPLGRAFGGVPGASPPVLGAHRGRVEHGGGVTRHSSRSAWVRPPPCRSARPGRTAPCSRCRGRWCRRTRRPHPFTNSGFLRGLDPVLVDPETSEGELVRRSQPAHPSSGSGAGWWAQGTSPTSHMPSSRAPKLCWTPCGSRSTTPSACHFEAATERDGSWRRRAGAPCSCPTWVPDSLDIYGPGFHEREWRGAICSRPPAPLRGALRASQDRGPYQARFVRYLLRKNRRSRSFPLQAIC